MNAWIDCLTYADDGMRAVHVGPGEILTLRLVGAQAFRTQAPDVFDALLDCAAFVNWRRLDVGDPAVLALAYDGG